jgi:transcriptional regulator with XRE-family HTH domain
LGGDEVPKSYSKLRGLIVEKYGSQRKFAEKIGLSEQTVVAKLADRSEFSQSDIIEWSNALDIPADMVSAYFFGEKLSKNESLEK